MINKFLCFIGFHDWHKYRYPDGARVQSYGKKQCERCGRLADGFAKKDHPDFRISKLTYKGIHVKTREYVPKNEVWFVDKKGRVTAVNITTGKVRKLKKNPYESPIF